jgi:hypothetical protein
MRRETSAGTKWKIIDGGARQSEMNAGVTMMSTVTSNMASNIN